MDDIKILRYQIKYQDSNIAIIKFYREDIDNFLKNSVIWIETDENPNSFIECFEEALFEIEGVESVYIYSYEIVVLKDIFAPNWGRILEDIIWSSLFFINPGGGAIRVSKIDGKNMGKMISHRFDTVEPNYRHKK